MGQIYKPYVFTITQPIAHNRCNENFQKLYDEFDGNLDDTNFKAGANINATKLLDASITGSKLVANSIGDGALVYTSTLVLRGGPNITNNGSRLASGAVIWELTTVQTTKQLWIPFAVAADRGDPLFAIAPRFLSTITRPIDTTNFPIGTILRVRTDAVYATGALITLVSTAVPNTDSQGEILWTAVGRV